MAELRAAAETVGTSSTRHYTPFRDCDGLLYPMSAWEADADAALLGLVERHCGKESDSVPVPSEIVSVLGRN
jgi:hypothetical protein